MSAPNRDNTAAYIGGKGGMRADVKRQLRLDKLGRFDASVSIKHAEECLSRLTLPRHQYNRCWLFWGIGRSSS